MLSFAIQPEFCSIVIREPDKFASRHTHDAQDGLASSVGFGAGVGQHFRAAQNLAGRL